MAQIEIAIAFSSVYSSDRNCSCVRIVLTVYTEQYFFWMSDIGKLLMSLHVNEVTL
jgi:hypothetical protein